MSRDNEYTVEIDDMTIPICHDCGLDGNLVIGYNDLTNFDGQELLLVTTCFTCPECGMRLSEVDCEIGKRSG